MNENQSFTDTTNNNVKNVETVQTVIDIDSKALEDNKPAQSVVANKKPSRRYADYVWSFIWITTLTLLMLKFAVYQQVNVVGESMEPGYYTSEMLLVNTIDKNIKRGQVAAIYEDKNAGKDANYFTRFNTKFYLKRIIGLPNEEIEVVGSTVIIYNSDFPDGTALPENYVGSKAKIVEDQIKYYFPKTKIPADSYFVMGDNRSNSTDSRVRGAFPSYDVFGQETLKYWPTSKFEVFHLPEYNLTPISPTLKAIRDEYRIKNKSNPAA